MINRIDEGTVELVGFEQWNFNQEREYFKELIAQSYAKKYITDKGRDYLLSLLF
jgi:hypothetical protein